MEYLGTQLPLTEHCLGPMGQPLHEGVDGVEEVQPNESDLSPIRTRHRINRCQTEVRREAIRTLQDRRG